MGYMSSFMPNNFWNLFEYLLYGHVPRKSQIYDSVATSKAAHFVDCQPANHRADAGHRLEQRQLFLCSIE